MKKTLALILALVMVALMLPVAAIVAGAETTDEPYHQIWDFTKLTPDDGSDNTINDNLPIGWESNWDPDTSNNVTLEEGGTWTTSINYDLQGNVAPVGVRLGGQGQGIWMNDKSGVPDDILNATVDYTLTVKFNVEAQLRHIRFGWSSYEVDEENNLTTTIKIPTLPEGDPYNTNDWKTSNQVAYMYGGGPLRGSVYYDGPDAGGNFTFFGKYPTNRRDEYGTLLRHDDIVNLHGDAALAGRDHTITFEIIDGAISCVHVTADGNTVTYYPPEYFPHVKGYLVMFISNWTTRNMMNIHSVEIKEGQLSKPVLPELSNVETLSNVNFTAVDSDGALATAGYKLYSANTDVFSKDGLVLKSADDFLLNTAITLDNQNSYILDYTFKYNSPTALFNAGLGFDAASDTVDKLKIEWASIESRSALKLIANKLTANGYTYYDETFATAKGTELPSTTADTTTDSVRVRILVTKGSGQQVFVSVGDEHFYMKKDTPFTQDSVSGLLGFSLAGSPSDSLGVTLQKCVISSCIVGNTTGGTEIVPDTEINYTDETATYYKDGYVLHNMNFSKVVDFKSTNYSFAKDSVIDRLVSVENGVLTLSSFGTKAAYLMFTGNAIPKNITEYTANFKFRFTADGNNFNSYLAFIRGISLDENGESDKSAVVEIQYKGGVYNGVTVPEDEVALSALKTAIQNGEWIEVSISTVKRMVEVVTVKFGDTTLSFYLEKNNKAAVAGYMGFEIGKNSKVEIASVSIVAGIAKNATDLIWPEGTTAGDLVQNVTVAAVAEGTKPEYPDPTIPTVDNTGDGEGENGDDEDQTPEATTTFAPVEGGKKGCSGSIVAVPAIIATAVLGCAVTVCKKGKKED